MRTVIYTFATIGTTLAGSAVDASFGCRENDVAACRAASATTVRNAHAHSHYPTGLEMTQGGVAPSQGAPLLLDIELR